MKYSCDRLQSMGIPIQHLCLLLDNQRVANCLAFDLEEGFIEVYRFKNGRPVAWPDGEPMIDKVFGQIRLFFLDPTSGIGVPWRPPSLH